MKKINIQNIEKLAAAVDAAQSKAKMRTVTAADIVRTLGNIRIPKSRLSGTKVYWDGGEHFPNAYKWTPESTHWTAENVNGTWYVTDISRGRCPNRNSKGRIEFSEAAKEWIISAKEVIADSSSVIC